MELQSYWSEFVAVAIDGIGNYPKLFLTIILDYLSKISLTEILDNLRLL